MSAVADPHGEAAGPAAGRPRLQPPLPLVSPRDRGHRHAAQGAGPRQLRLQVPRLNRDIIIVISHLILLSQRPRDGRLRPGRGRGGGAGDQAGGGGRGRGQELGGDREARTLTLN